MKFLVCLLLFLSVLTNFSAFADIISWQELKSEHFVIYFLSDESFAKDVLNKAEVYYRRIASDLGYPRYSEFWTWDNRVKIYIYPDHNSFVKATKQPSWSQGMADYTNKEIISYNWSEGFVDALLPHEMAHLIFRDFVGFKGEVPLWLDEGVAQWAEEDKRREVSSIAKKLVAETNLISLEDMMRLDVRNAERKKGIIYVKSIKNEEGGRETLFLSDNNLVSIYYLQAVSLVTFMIDHYGSNSFVAFCRELREGKSLKGALKSAYPAHIQSLDDLEREWVDYLKNKEE